jgi:NADP-dependent 3-hydroxy acid dehydrogenase YdfG
MSSKVMGTALIAGASTGIGRAKAEFLAGRRYRVFGTARHPDHVTPIEGVELLPLDVRDDASVAAGVDAVTGRIDMLVNNAGYAAVGASRLCSWAGCAASCQQARSIGAAARPSS